VGALAALPLKYSSNFFVKRPQIVKRQRCARRGGGRGERIKASQRDKFEAAAERIRSKKNAKIWVSMKETQLTIVR
jgi:hypothetical protein